MPLFLTERNKHLTERMEQSDCDKEMLFNTYRQFAILNWLISGWRGIYNKMIYPLLAENPDNFSLLDIGCGGGDVLRLLYSLSEKDGFNPVFTGIDPDPNSYEYISTKQWPKNISFLQSTSDKLVNQNRSFDVVISNHLVHHLGSEQLRYLCEDAQHLATQRVIFNDIERSDLGYISFFCTASLIFHNSFIVPDGLTSIKRSYTKKELQSILPEGWRVQQKFPYRLLCIFDK